MNFKMNLILLSFASFMITPPAVMAARYVEVECVDADNDGYCDLTPEQEADYDKYLDEEADRYAEEAENGKSSISDIASDLTNGFIDSFGTNSGGTSGDSVPVPGGAYGTGSVNGKSSIDVCSSPVQLHEQKMLKYGMSDVPSLLHDCGLDSIFAASGIFDIFNKFKLSIPHMDLLCGYSTKDITNWYGVPSDYKYDVGIEAGYDLEGDWLKGGDDFFKTNVKLK